MRERQSLNAIHTSLGKKKGLGDLPQIASIVWGTFSTQTFLCHAEVSY